MTPLSLPLHINIEKLMQESKYHTTLHWSVVKSFLIAIVAFGLFVGVFFLMLKTWHNFIIVILFPLLFLWIGLKCRNKMAWWLSSKATIYCTPDSFFIKKDEEENDTYCEYSLEDISSYSFYFSGKTVSIMLYMRYDFFKQLTFKDKNIINSIKEDESILKIFTSCINNFNRTHDVKIYYRKGFMCSKVVSAIMYLLVIAEVVLFIYVLSTNPQHILSIIYGGMLVVGVWASRYSSVKIYKDIVDSGLVDAYIE